MPGVKPHFFCFYNRHEDQFKDTHTHLPSQCCRRGRRGWRCGCSSSWMDGGRSPWQQSWGYGQSMKRMTGAEGRTPCLERPLRWACTCCCWAEAAGGRVDLRRQAIGGEIVTSLQQSLMKLMSWTTVPVSVDIVRCGCGVFRRVHPLTRSLQTNVHTRCSNYKDWQSHLVGHSKPLLKKCTNFFFCKQCHWFCQSDLFVFSISLLHKWGAWFRR